jgi:hypothetical protein
VTLDDISKSATVTVASFLNADMKAAGKAPMYSQQIILAGLPPDGQNAFAYAEAQLADAEPPGDGQPIFSNRYVFAGAEIVE